MTALEYLQKELEQAERSMQYARNKKGVTPIELKDIGRKIDLITECIEAVENYCGNGKTYPIHCAELQYRKSSDPIPWAELQYRKSRPIYIREKAAATGEWFGWWDILDDVFPKFIRTAYSEEMMKANKGLTWDVFDVQVN